MLSAPLVYNNVTRETLGLRPGLVGGWGGEVNYHVPGRNLAFLYIYGLWKCEFYALQRTDNIIIVNRLYCIISLINEIYKRNIKTDLLHSVTVRKNIL